MSGISSAESELDASSQLLSMLRGASVSDSVPGPPSYQGLRSASIAAPESYSESPQMSPVTVNFLPRKSSPQLLSQRLFQQTASSSIGTKLQAVPETHQATQQPPKQPELEHSSSVSMAPSQATSQMLLNVLMNSTKSAPAAGVGSSQMLPSLDQQTSTQSQKQAADKNALLNLLLKRS